MLDITKKNASVKLTKPFMKGEDGGYYWPEWNDEGQLIWQASEDGMPIIPPFDVKGEDGGYYTPITDDNGELNWVPSNENMPAVTGASLATKEYVDEAVKDVDVDLSEYAKKTDIPDVSGLATKAEIPSLEGYAKTADIPSLDGYAKTTDIPDTSGLATKAEIPDVSGFTTMSAVEAKGYQTEEEVRAIVEESGGGSGGGGISGEVFVGAKRETIFEEYSNGLNPQGTIKLQSFIDTFKLQPDTTYYFSTQIYSGSDTVRLGTAPNTGDINQHGAIKYDGYNFIYGENKIGVICEKFNTTANNYFSFRFTPIINGANGLVPAPELNDENKILFSDATWKSSPVISDDKNNVFTNDYNSFTINAPYATNSFIEGYKNSLIGAYSMFDYNHIEGTSNKIELVSGAGAVSSNHVEGNGNIMRGSKSHIDGQSNTIGAGIECATVSGRGNTIPNILRQQNPQTGVYEYIEGSYAHISGYYNTTTGEASSVEGTYNNAYVPSQHVQGKYSINDVDGAYVDIVGNGTGQSDTARSNAYTLDWSGNATFAGTVTSSGADYAEYFEWLDGNPEEEDRVGYIVKLNGNKIEFANADDDILGIISGTMTVLGDNAEWYWQGKYLTDNFGRVIYEDKAEWRTFINPETQKEEKCIIGVFPAPKLNPNYDADMPYENRKVRPEWDAVGMMGKLYVRDDGTAQVNGYVTANNGIATASGTRTNMRVMERVSENIIRVCLK